MSIQDFFSNINRLFRENRGLVGDILIALCIVFVGISGFFLGRMSALEAFSEPFIPEARSVVGASVLSDTVEQGSDETVVGSKNGTKYHYPWCSGALRMKEENKVYFSSPEQAREQGYAPAANCKGLK